ncbi:MAG: anion permease [Lachnospiraceae bacterium]|nr:anion permease [Lachnospiraceae bacterium]
MIVALIFCVCILLFLWDKYAPSLVALAGCVALVVTGASPITDAFSGFINDIVYIILGTELLGIACQESGLASLVSDFICKNMKGDNAKSVMKKLIFFLGVGAAILSAFINNQVVSSLVLITCISISGKEASVNVKTITLPIIYAVILGGQCTLVGAPATLISSSMSEELTGYKLSMFSLLPMGALIMAVGILYLSFFGVQQGEKVWGESAPCKMPKQIAVTPVKNSKQKCLVVLFAGLVMITLFITNVVSVGMASMVAGLICLFGGVMPAKEAWKKVDWNILIWLGCSIGMANALNQSGILQHMCDVAMLHMPKTIHPVVLLIAMVLVTTILSNFIANTTTVIMIIPIAVSIVKQYGFEVEPFVIAITMAAGFSVMTPLSCGFIGMTMRLGYKFNDYIKYGAKFQALITTLVIVMTVVMYKF